MRWKTGFDATESVKPCDEQVPQPHAVRRAGALHSRPPPAAGGHSAQSISDIPFLATQGLIETLSPALLSSAPWRDVQWSCVCFLRRSHCLAGCRRFSRPGPA